jgi:glutamate formiminotransferase/glutamate formiminotransferase/formiminotetrahydrofolate cyclodeaminase
LSVVLLAVPNVSEGSDELAVAEIADAFAAGGAQLLDIHSDPDHGRSVVTLAAESGSIARALLAGAREAVDRIDLTRHRGLHPHVGALDVAPVVYVDPRDRGAACAEALVAADLIATELAIPVFLYGVLADGRTRAELRRGGAPELARRLRAGELAPDFGPPELHPTAGATLIAARPPLVAFNVELAAPATLAEASAIAARIREGGSEGLPGVRAIGLELASRGNVAQVSLNVEDPATPLAAVIAAIARHAGIAEAELVGLAPAAAFAGFPEDVAVRNRRTIEDAVGS